MGHFKKRSPITGGAGFLGSHLCDRLVDAGRDVLNVDNFFTGTNQNIGHRSDRPNFEPLLQDDPLQRQPDIGLTQKHLDWTPHIGLVAG